jgi:predicted P-loop ATPase
MSDGIWEMRCRRRGWDPRKPPPPSDPPPESEGGSGEAQAGNGLDHDDLEAPTFDDEPGPGDAPSGGVSFIITHAQKAELAARGFTPEQISEMTPAVAHALLGLGSADQPLDPEPEPPPGPDGDSAPGAGDRSSAVDWDELVAKTKADQGAPFGVVDDLAELKLRDRAAYEALLGLLRKAKCRVAALDKLVDAKNKPPPPPPPPPPPKGQAWRSDLWVSDTGKIIPNLRNVDIALRGAPELRNAFAFDEMTRAEMLMEALPLAPKGAPAGAGAYPREVHDEDVSQLQEWLQDQGMTRIAKDVVHTGVHQRARERRYHPLRDWLSYLRWDGKPRVRTWLTVYLGADSTRYAEEIGRMFLISMVARVLQPGVKVDYMLILEGAQGDEKSTACAVLAGEYFSDQLPDITNKDSALHLRGKWLIEVAELSVYSRAAVDHFKGFVTRAVEKYRPPYARNDVIEPRQCVFIGTTNKPHYLRDETGNRRFWPVKIGKIETYKLRADREQLFAEAVQLYRDGVKWWPERAFEAQTIAPEQDARYEPDVWEDAIADFLRKLQSSITTPAKTTVLDVAKGALGFDDSSFTTQGKTSINRLSPGDQRRIVAVLIHLG